MRRLLSLTLLLLFCWPLVSPALALTGATDTSLPACCRKSGAHHCSMTVNSQATTGPGLHLTAKNQPCPCFPAMATQVQHGDLSFPSASLFFAELLSHPTVKAQTEAFARVARDRSRQKRGPPSRLL